MAGHDAAMQGRSGGRAWTILAALALGRMAFGYQIQTVASIAPELLTRLGLDYTALGTLIGLYLAPGVVIALPSGLLARRFGDRLVVGGGLVLMTAGAVICAGGDGRWWIGAGRAVSGVGAVALVVLQPKIIAEWFAGRGFMVALSIAIGAYPVGVGLAELTQARLAADLGWKAAFLAGGVIAGAAAILFLVSFRAAPDAPAPAAPGRAHASFPGLRECALVIVAGLMWTAYNAGYLGFLSYVPSLLASRGAAAGFVGLVIALATWSNVPGMLAGSALAVRLGSWPVYLVATLALSCGVAGMAAFGRPLLWAAGFGLIGSLHCSVIIALGATSTPPEHRAVGMGLFYTTYYLGGAMLPALFGRAADYFGGPAGALYAAASFALLGIPAFWLHRRLQAGRPAVAVAG